MEQPRTGQHCAPRQITILCDNESVNPRYGCEWGLALAIDLGPGASDGGLWLWDAGQTDLFLKNARLLDLDVGQARGLALSHGHFDHTGGINALLGTTSFCGFIHAHPACASQRYAQGKGQPKPIGPPNPLPKFVPAEPLTVLAPGLTLLTDIPRAPGNFQAVQGFSLDQMGAKPDTVPDDAFLVMESASGPVVILGCCHSGLANSLACMRQRLGIRQVHAVLGGLHLYRAEAEALEETARALEEFDVRRLMAGHCTGPDRLARLEDRLPNRDVLPLAAGQRWSF